MNIQQNKFSGWWVFIGCFLLNFFATATITGTAPLFQTAILDEFSFMNSGNFSLVFLICSVASAAGAMFFAPKLQKGNMNKIMTICAVVTAALFGLNFFSSKVWHFMVTGLIYNFTLSALTQVPTAMMITSWFIDRRSTVMSIAFAGNSVGTFAWSALFGRVMDSGIHGWAYCYVIGGAALALVVIPVALFLVKKDPKLNDQEPYTISDDKKKTSTEDKKSLDTWAGVGAKVAYKSSAFIFFILAVISIGVMFSGVATQVTNYLVHDCGWAKSEGASLLGLYAIMTAIAMFFIAGPIYDKIGVTKGTTVSLIFAAIAIACLFFVEKSVVFAYGYAVFLALAGGLPKLYASLTIPKLFGYKAYGPIYGFVNLWFLLGAMLGSVIAGVLGATAGYTVAWAFFIALMLIAVFFVNAAVIAAKKLRVKYPEGDAVTV